MDDKKEILEEKEIEQKEEKTSEEKKPKEKKKKDWRKILGIILCILALLILLGFAIYHGVMNYYLSKLNIVTKEEEEFVTQRITVEEKPFETQEEEEYIEKDGFDRSKFPAITDSKEVTNILLLATDGRSLGGAGRSDVMMLVSVNRESKKIVLCSFLRDIWALYPTKPENPISGGFDKLNHAHAYGGANLTMAVLKESFHVDVSHYVKVDFSDFVKVVDAMGGVDLYLSSAEADYINRTKFETINASHNDSYQCGELAVQDGMHHLNGIQALCHSRNRTIGSDWARTQRQRNVLTAMAKKAGSLSLDQINSLMNTTLPLVTTNMQKDLLKDLIASLPAFITYDIESTKIPQEGSYTSVNYNMVTDRKANYFYLYKTIYGVEPKEK